MNQTVAKKNADASTAPLCCNCDMIIEKPLLFCNQLCTDEAAFVRSVRRWRKQGREHEPDIRETIKIQLAHILNGGYPRKERELSEAIRSQVIARAKGRCQAVGCDKPGRDIDHIHGNGRDLGNLQYLCRACHIAKTNAGLKPITPDHPKYAEYRAKVAVLTARYSAKKPKRPCDDHESWEKAWRIYKKERRVPSQTRKPRKAKLCQT